MSRSSKTKRRRDPKTIANRRLPVSYSPTRVTPTTILRQIEDRRLFNPTRSYSAPATLSFTKARIQYLESPAARKQAFRADPMAYLRRLGGYVTPKVAFKDPSSVLICVRRQIRKEVLHAFKKTASAANAALALTNSQKSHVGEQNEFINELQPFDVINIPLQWEAARQQKDAINETNKRNMEMNRENQALQRIRPNGRAMESQRRPRCGRSPSLCARRKYPVI